MAAELCQILRMVTVEIVINSTRVMGVRVNYPAGMHCPSWDDAFVSSFVCLFVTLQITLQINRRRAVGMRPQKYQKFPLFGKESPHRGDSLDRFPKCLGAFIRLTILH